MYVLVLIMHADNGMARASGNIHSFIMHVYSLLMRTLSLLIYKITTYLCCVLGQHASKLTL
jgi:hypothetical protein